MNKCMNQDSKLSVRNFSFYITYGKGNGRKYLVKHFKFIANEPNLKFEYGCMQTCVYMCVCYCLKNLVNNVF